MVSLLVTTREKEKENNKESNEEENSQTYRLLLSLKIILYFYT